MSALVDPASAAMLLLAWRPFLDPLDIQSGWLWFLPPLVLAIAVTYKAVRAPTLENYWIAVGRMTIQVLAALFGLAVISFVLVQWLLPTW